MNLPSRKSTGTTSFGTNLPSSTSFAIRALPYTAAFSACSSSSRSAYKWRNYLLPVDVSAESAEEPARNAVAASDVLSAFAAAGTRLNILVLDACRDNPFGKLPATHGLADMEAPAGTIIAFSTAPAM
ncbi:MAG: hypothetical protein AB7G13_19520 [Lautropia sp.]